MDCEQARSINSHCESVLLPLAAVINSTGVFSHPDFRPSSSQVRTVALNIDDAIDRLNAAKQVMAEISWETS